MDRVRLGHYAGWIGFQMMAGEKEILSMKSDSGITPLYRRVKDHILWRIQTGDLTEFDRVPSENELVNEFKVSRMTANRALRELAVEGQVVRVAGVGTFVAAQKAHSHLLEIRDIAEEVRTRGHHYSSTVVSNTLVRVSRDLAQKMGLRVGSRVFNSVIVHREQGVPIQLEIRYVSRRIAPEYGEQDFATITPSAYLQMIAPLREVEHVVQAVLPDSATANLLDMGRNEPCLLVRRRTWVADGVATYAKLYHPGSRYELEGRLRKP